MNVSYADVLNEKGLFSLDIPTFEKTTFNDDISFTFDFSVQNNENFDQEILLSIPSIQGWDIETQALSFDLIPGEKKDVSIDFVANSEFEYSSRYEGADLIKIKLNDGYSGVVYFPIKVVSGEDDVDFTFEGDIISKEEINVFFLPKISSSRVSPETPIGFSVESKELFQNQIVQVDLFIDDIQLYSKEHTFEENHQYQVFQQDVPASYDPGRYTIELVVRHEDSLNSAREWNAKQQIIIDDYTNLDVTKEFSKTLIKDQATYTITNLGNVDDVFEYTVSHNGFMSLFFGAEFSNGLDIDFTTDSGDVVFSLPLDRGETIEFTYYYNFIPLYVILFVIAILVMYIYLRKTSNPLSVETKIYEVKKDSHEGVKSIKLRIGFENIRSEEIESLRMIFRMPNYLSVKDDSFLLTPPKQVLKGNTHYKLVWDFKRFEKEDSRILGFKLVNSKGILGDIRIEDLEFEVKINGRVRKYYSSFPIVRG
jgi:hypothetical protein